MINHLVDWVTQFISHTGYPGVILLMALESACIPIPSEAIMPFAGSLIVTQHKFNFHMLAFAGALGNLSGSMVAYWVGAIGGRPFLEKFGRFVLIRKRDLDKSDRFFHKYGDATAFFSRMLPIVRTFISLPAGISRMPFGKFCLFTFAGALPFCYLLTWAGLQLGRNWHQVHIWLQRFDTAIVGVLLVLFVFWLWHHLRPNPEEEAAEGGTKSPDAS